MAVNNVKDGNRVQSLSDATTGLVQSDAVASEALTNPLTVPWTGPFNGVPPFDQAKVEFLEPALRAGMHEQLAAVERIASDPNPPTFDNTIAALERSSRMLDRAGAIFSVLTGSLSNDAVRAVEEEMEPKLSDHGDQIIQNEKLFARIAAVYEAREKENLTPEQSRLVWQTYRDFVTSGAKLDPASKTELSTINRKLATLSTRFSQNLLKAETEAIFLKDPTDLKGLPEALQDAAARAAIELGQPGSWAIQNTRSSVEPFLTYASNRAAREQVWKMFINRGDGGETDTNPLIPEILSLRTRRALLLGYPTHAHLQLEDTMAKTPERAQELLEAVWNPAVARVRTEIAELQAVADRDDPGVRIAPWDYRYYQEKVRAEKYDLNESEVTPYLQLDRLREGMFHVARELFGLEFREVAPEAVPVYHPDVRVWEIVQGSGAHVGLLYFDPFKRDGKTSGAWMSDFRSQERMDGEIAPIVSNTCNFVKGAPGEPTIISWEDAETLFHEFGHALHGICSNAVYPSLCGTNVPGDFVELPSQLLEHWLATPEILAMFARHYQTDEAMPSELVEKIKRAKGFNEGFRTLEYLASAIADLKLHLAGETPIDPKSFERETLSALGMPDEVVMRHRLPHFAHIFSGESYSATYYCYLWADTLAADAWEAFMEAGGAWDKTVAARLHQYILSSGNTNDPADSYRKFRGRDAGVDALMRKRGFAAR
jgi:peptidyl-dipeptidase Dcp